MRFLFIAIVHEFIEQPSYIKCSFYSGRNINTHICNMLLMLSYEHLDFLFFVVNFRPIFLNKMFYGKF